MSGIYIPGMEMPTSCAFCRFCDGLADTQVGTCAFCMVDGKYRDARTNYACPLVPIPEHGRLGDLDDVINDVRHYLCEGCWGYLGPDAKTESCDYCGATMLIKAIERKSSIIPADREGE